MFSEFRFNPPSGDWVVVAPQRRKRPKFSHSCCPFCKGIKNQEPPLAVICKDSSKNFSYSWKEAKNRKRELCKDWKIVSFPNKYPALTPPLQNQKIKIRSTGLYKKIEGVGYHEVIVYREHNKPLSSFSQEEMVEAVKMYRDRFEVLERDENVKYIALFTNYKPQGGASLEHPHSQLIATPLIDPDLRKEINGAKSFFKKNKKCVFCEMIKLSLKDKKRVIYQNKEFIAIAPFAPFSAFEVRIYPKKHSNSFRELSNKQIFWLADILRKILKAIRKAANDPPYNFFIHSLPSMKGVSYFHWHLVIFPRLSKIAGFELGAGIQIVSFSPEETAKTLREKIPKR